VADCGGPPVALANSSGPVSDIPRAPVFDLIVAILGTATGGASGLIEGVFGGL
jgi:hypothetical protein